MNCFDLRNRQRDPTFPRKNPVSVWQPGAYYYSLATTVVATREHLGSYDPRILDLLCLKTTPLPATSEVSGSYGEVLYRHADRDLVGYGLTT